MSKAVAVPGHEMCEIHYIYFTSWGDCPKCPHFQRVTPEVLRENIYPLISRKVCQILAIRTHLEQQPPLLLAPRLVPRLAPRLPPLKPLHTMLVASVQIDAPREIVEEFDRLKNNV